MAETEVALVSKPQEVELGLEKEEEQSHSSSSSFPPPPPLSSNPSSNDDLSVENLDLDLKKLGLEEEEDENEIVKVKEEKTDDDHQFPQRVGEPDCAYFLRYGTCRYGLNCRYNHPSSISRNQGRSSSKSPESVVEVAYEEGGEEKEKKGNQERPGQVECKYYFRPGGCKYGKACRFQHPLEERTYVGPPLDLNFLGLPIRPGEKECVFYMRNGSCKFANNCRFHHPDPTDPGGLDPRFRNDGSLQLHSSGLSQPTVTSWTLPRSSNEMVPFLDAPPSYGSVSVAPPSYGSVSVAPPSYGSVSVAPPSYGSVSVVPPPQGVHPTLEWNRYMAPVNPLYPPTVNMGHMGLIPSGIIAKKPDGFTPHQLQMPIEEFPERPGQLECQYFLKNGDCKFKSNCKFDHPKDKAPKCVLNAMGLPLRPDQIVCSYYSRYGICKFGPACKYDHPPNCGSSALGGARNGSESLIPQSV